MQKCCSIQKGTAKRESAEVLFHSERNSKMDNHKMQTCKKTNSLFTALMLRMSYTLNEATPETQNIREIRKETTFYLKKNM